MRERDLEHYLVELADQSRCFLRKVRWVGRNGAPDRLLIDLDGNITWVELKAPGKSPTAQQEREHSRMRVYGQKVVVVDSIDAIEELFQ